MNTGHLNILFFLVFISPLCWSNGEAKNKTIIACSNALRTTPGNVVQSWGPVISNHEEANLFSGNAEEYGGFLFPARGIENMAIVLMTEKAVYCIEKPNSPCSENKFCSLESEIGSLNKHEKWHYDLELSGEKFNPMKRKIFHKIKEGNGDKDEAGEYISVTGVKFQPVKASLCKHQEEIYKYISSLLEKVVLKLHASYKLGNKYNIENFKGRFIATLDKCTAVGDPKISKSVEQQRKLFKSEP